MSSKIVSKIVFEFQTKSMKIKRVNELLQKLKIIGTNYFYCATNKNARMHILLNN